ncbi:MAG: hypothetical protein KKA81_00925 [Bacteroidetes bacterium]|nr:hypothetical protein [Bacteroidota bacterium]
MDTDTTWFNQRLADGGPVYTETNLQHWLVEPWNAITSLLVIIPALYWLFSIRKEYRYYSFMVYAIPLFMLGGIGSALFHGFRTSVVFLVMDVLPTAVLTLSIGIYFWLKILKKWWYVLLIIIPIFLLRFLLFAGLPDHLAINLSYALTGFTIILPLVFVLVRTKFYQWHTIAITIFLFALALLFRETDPYSGHVLPMGSHFLWHFFSALGAWFILSYLYHFRKREKG